MRYRRLHCAALSALLTLSQVVRAEDIDLFLGTPPGVVATPPNVLFLIDNTANWNTAFTNEKAALVNVFNGLPVNTDGSAKFNVGVMLFTETGNPNSNIDGGYMRAAIRPMNTDNKALYGNLINSFHVLNDRSNGGKAGLTMAEAYYYFSSRAARSGTSKAKTDYTGNVSGTTQSNAVYALADDRDVLSTFAGTTYNGPILSNCAKNFIIYISNGAAQDNNADNTTATTLLSALPDITSAGLTGAAKTAPITISPSGSQTNVADEWARYMRHSPEQLTVYTLDIDKVTTGQGPGWTAMLKSMANASGGKYFDVSSGVSQNIVDALNTVLSEILAVNTVFASVSLPASANTQSTFLNQVFIGMFRPDRDALPRWPGNLKQYKLGLLDGNIKLLDAGNASAINANTGFITECARSFWTPTTVDTYWATAAQGACAAVANSIYSNYPDGPVVEKGAQGYVLRSSTTRTVKTCSPTFASCTSLTDFDNANPAITGTLLGDAAMTSTRRTALIGWARGLDTGVDPVTAAVVDERLNGVTSGEMRASAHGDIIHSRPVAINYGGDDYLGNNAAVADASVVVYYSGNDGMLRAINGNRTAAIGSTAAGRELWSFIAPEFWDDVKKIHDNNVRVAFPGLAGTTQPKPYAIDGPITAYQGDVSGTNKVFLYAGMRRGGRALYAFDVTTPASPTLKWKRGCPSASSAVDTDCTNNGTNGDWRGIGQTWSPATPVKTLGYTKPVLLLGGGYDACEDYDAGTAGGANHNCATTKGNAIYVIDADTGNLLQTLSTVRGVAGAITLVPDEQGNLQYAYAADLGGNLYRLSGLDANTPIASTAPGSWTLTRVASLGCASPGAGCTANRKFLFGPDVVPNNGGYLLMLGSGDREKPLGSYVSANAVTNHFYAVQDQPTNATWLSAESGTCGSSLLCVGALYPIPANSTPTSAQLATKKGWYLTLSSSENVVTSAITVSNRLTFSTFKPAVYDANACTGNLGEANVYNVNYANAAGLDSEDRYQRVTGDGLPPSPVAGKVILDDGSIVPFLIGGSADSPLEALNPSAAADFEAPKGRVYWHIKQ